MGDVDVDVDFVFWAHAGIRQRGIDDAMLRAEKKLFLWHFFRKLWKTFWETKLVKTG